MGGSVVKGMKIFSIIPLYLLSLLMFVGFFVGGVYFGCRFVLSLAMEALGYPTGLAAVFPKIIALAGGFGGGFWGLLLAAALTRFFRHHWTGEVKFGERPLLNTTMSAFLTFVLVTMLFIATFGERTNLDTVLKILLET
jgi:hypothetical protein